MMEVTLIVEIPVKTGKGFLNLVEGNSSDAIDERFDLGRLDLGRHPAASELRDSGASPESNRTWMAIDEDEEEIGEESSKGFEEDPLNRYF